jgi:hypothetical protein
MEHVQFRNQHGIQQPAHVFATSQILVIQIHFLLGMIELAHANVCNLKYVLMVNQPGTKNLALAFAKSLSNAETALNGTKQPARAQNHTNAPNLMEDVRKHFLHSISIHALANALSQRNALLVLLHGINFRVHANAFGQKKNVRMRYPISIKKNAPVIARNPQILVLETKPGIP